MTRNRSSHLLSSLIVASLGLIASACVSGGGNEDGGSLTAGDVEAGWRLAAECLDDAGYLAVAEEDPSGWGISFDGNVEESNAFMEDYEFCVSDAERLSLEFAQTQIPEGEERLELAASFDECIKTAGLEPLNYDLNNADEVAALAEVTIQLGYRLDETAVADDPRFNEALDCFETHELLFPNRFESD